MPGLMSRMAETRINRFIVSWFKAFMTFLFGADSPACTLTPVDLMKAAAVYLSSSGVLYEVIQSYITGRNHQRPIREAMIAGLVVLMADLSHRYAGSTESKDKDFAFKKTG